MGVGGLGLATMNWGLILTMVTMMGVHSTVFSPSLNGSIPELYPASYVTRANAKIKLATTTAILLAMVLAAVLLDVKGPEVASMPLPRFLVACSAMAVAIGGFLGALGCPRRLAADPAVKFPWSGPAATLKVLWLIRKDRLLAFTVAVATFVWALGVFQVLLIGVLGRKYLGVSKAFTGALTFAEMIGIAVGGLLAGWLTTRWKWYRLLSPAAVALGVAMMGMLLLSPNPSPGGPEPVGSLLAAGGLLFLAGVGGGMMLIPLESFVQVRPRAEDRGSVISAANCAEFIGISIAGAIFALLYPGESEAVAAATQPVAPVLAPTIPFAVLGAVTVVVGLLIPRLLKGVKE
jgi:acyl-[acyl-carrier-protein]-phospholipid O-acyltransferase/long-chain-fatty-acid--[acyl-carrier-protein] ligase